MGRGTTSLVSYRSPKLSVKGCNLLLLASKSRALSLKRCLELHILRSQLCEVLSQGLLLIVSNHKLVAKPLNFASFDTVLLAHLDLLFCGGQLAFQLLLAFVLAFPKFLLLEHQFLVLSLQRFDDSVAVSQNLSQVSDFIGLVLQLLFHGFR